MEAPAERKATCVCYRAAPGTSRLCKNCPPVTSAPTQFASEPLYRQKHPTAASEESSRPVAPEPRGRGLRARARQGGGWGWESRGPRRGATHVPSARRCRSFGVLQGDSSGLVLPPLFGPRISQGWFPPGGSPLLFSPASRPVPSSTSRWPGCRTGGPGVGKSLCSGYPLFSQMIGAWSVWEEGTKCKGGRLFFFFFGPQVAWRG